MLEVENLIIGGDLNFSLDVSNSWYPRVKFDSLFDSFVSKIIDNFFLDIETSKLKPSM